METNEDYKKIEEMCTRKYEFICRYMKKQFDIQTTHFSYAPCPIPVNISDGNYSKDNFTLITQKISISEAKPTNSYVTVSVGMFTNTNVHSIIDKTFFLQIGNDLDKFINNIRDLPKFEKNSAGRLASYNFGHIIKYQITLLSTEDVSERKKVLFLFFVACLKYFFKVIEQFLIRKYKNDYDQHYVSQTFNLLNQLKFDLLAIVNTELLKSVPINNVLHEEYNAVMNKDFQESFKIDYSKELLFKEFCSTFKSKLPDVGSVFTTKNAIGLGIGAAALYGLKKWKDYKNAKTDSSSSSSSSKHKLKKSKGTRKRKRASKSSGARKKSLEN